MVPNQKQELSLSPRKKETEQVRSPQKMLKETGEPSLVTGDNWLLYLMLLLTQTLQLEHLLVSEAEEDRWLLPCLSGTMWPGGQSSGQVWLMSYLGDSQAAGMRWSWRRGTDGHWPAPSLLLLPSWPDRAGCCAGASERGTTLQACLYPGGSHVDYAWPPRRLLLCLDLARDVCYSLGNFAEVLE